MTSHYIDLTVVPDAETGVPALLGVLYSKLHHALVQQRQNSIGVSFPGYSVIPRGLGSTLRLHGPESDLTELLRSDWLGGVRDHVRDTGVQPVPESARHRTVARKQFKTSAARLRRRRMRRKGETPEQAALAIPDSVERTPSLPYIHMRSLSTGQSFCLFLALGPVRAVPAPGTFNTYGLSSRATIPWF